MTTLHQRLLGLLALLLVMTSLAQEPPNFARVQALEKAVYSSASADVDGGLLITSFVYGTNAQSLGGNPAFPASSPNQVRMILAKLDRHGTAQWSHQVSVTNTHSLTPYGVIRDSQSNVVWLGILTKWEAPDVVLGLDGTNFLSVSGPFNSRTAFFIKFDSSGHFLLTKVLPLNWLQPDYAGIPALAATPDGGFLLGGMNPPLRRFDASGNELWTVNSSGSPVLVRAVQTDPDGNIFFTGRFGTNSFLGGTNLQTAMPSIYQSWGDIPLQTFVARADSNGAIQWAITTGTNWEVTAFSLCLDQQTNVFIAGMSDSFDVFGFPTGVDPSWASPKWFVAKCSSTGVPLWMKNSQFALNPANNRFGGWSQAHAVRCDPSGAVYVGGEIEFGGHSFDGLPLYVGGEADAFISKYDSDGRFQWARKAGNPAESTIREAVNSLVVNVDGVIAIGHFIASNAVFGPLTVSTGAVFNTGSSPSGDICTFLALIPHPAPPLATELTGAELKVSWPTFPPEFELETATALGTPTLWSSNSVPMSTSNGTHSVTFPVDGPARYFRLRKPIP